MIRTCHNNHTIHYGITQKDKHKHMMRMMSEVNKDNNVLMIMIRTFHDVGRGPLLPMLFKVLLILSSSLLDCSSAMVY